LISIETAYTWLNRFKPGRTCLSPPARFLLDQINEALTEGDVKIVNSKINELLKLGDLGKNNQEMAEIRIECARIFYAQGNLKLADDYLTQAANHYLSDRHNLAVALWMRGAVRWRIPNKQIEAMDDWNRSRALFTSLSQSVYSRVEDGKWYQERSKKMQVAIQEAIGNDGLPNKAVVNILQVFDQASGFVHLAGNCASVDQVTIEGTLFRLVSLVGKKVFNLFDNQTSYIIVKASSAFTLEGGCIQDGDYVLLQQNTNPEQQDIVLVNFPENGDIPSFMRYVEQNGVVHFFKDEASQQPSKKIIKSLFKQQYEIRGVVVGVFRPLKPSWN